MAERRLAAIMVTDASIVLGHFGTDRPDVLYPTARPAALRALEIEQALGDAQASLATVRVNYDWDWTGAERAFPRALGLRPGSAHAHHWYALYLSAMGRFDQARPEIHHDIRGTPEDRRALEAMGLAPAGESS
jgi:tetratricopeptide (TPR) repeat protein